MKRTPIELATRLESPNEQSDRGLPDLIVAETVAFIHFVAATYFTSDSNLNCRGVVGDRKVTWGVTQVPVYNRSNLTLDLIRLKTVLVESPIELRWATLARSIIEFCPKCAGTTSGGIDTDSQTPCFIEYSVKDLTHARYSYWRACEAEQAAD